MSSVELIQTYLSYNEALNRRMWESSMTLSDVQFLADIPYSHGSIRDQVVHLAAVDGRWLRGLGGKPDARTYNPPAGDYPTRQAAFDLWEGVAGEWAEYTAALTEEDLNQIPPGMPGPAWQVLLHVANHGTDHRAQILRALYDFGAPTFDQDLILYLWSR